MARIVKLEDDIIQERKDCDVALSTQLERHTTAISEQQTRHDNARIHYERNCDAKIAAMQKQLDLLLDALLASKEEASKQILKRARFDREQRASKAKFEDAILSANTDFEREASSSATNKIVSKGKLDAAVLKANEDYDEENSTSHVQRDSKLPITKEDKE